MSLTPILEAIASCSRILQHWSKSGQYSQSFPVSPDLDPWLSTLHLLQTTGPRRSGVLSLYICEAHICPQNSWSNHWSDPSQHRHWSSHVWARMNMYNYVTGRHKHSCMYAEQFSSRILYTQTPTLDKCSLAMCLTPRDSFRKPKNSISIHLTTMIYRDAHTTSSKFRNERCNL